MSGSTEGWRRQDEAFWRAHHEVWKRSDLNQRKRAVLGVWCSILDLPSAPYDMLVFAEEALDEEELTDGPSDWLDLPLWNIAEVV